MKDIKKFKVIRLFNADKNKLQTQSLEDFLNERYDMGEELVAIFGDKFIFKNMFYTTMKTVEDYLEK